MALISLTSLTSVTSDTKKHCAMTDFDIRRFARVARWQCRMSLKSALSFASGLSFGYLFPMLGWLYPALKGAKGATADRLIHSVEMCTLVYMIVLVIAGTWIFADMKTKEQRTAVKMLPATDLEKFIVRWLGITLGALVLGLAAYCVADVLRMVTCLVVGVDYVGCTIPDFLRMFFTNAEVGLITAGQRPEFISGVYFSAVSWCVWAQSLYVLGGTLLCRYRFAVTSAVHVVLFVAFAVVVSSASVDVEATAVNAGNNAAFYAVGTVLTAVAVVNWWLSYKIFRRMQVINNKWINL